MTSKKPFAVKFDECWDAGRKKMFKGDSIVGTIVEVEDVKEGKLGDRILTIQVVKYSKSYWKLCIQHGWKVGFLIDDRRKLQGLMSDLELDINKAKQLSQLSDARGIRFDAIIDARLLSDPRESDEILKCIRHNSPSTLIVDIRDIEEAINTEKKIEDENEGIHVSKD